MVKMPNGSPQAVQAYQNVQRARTTGAEFISLALGISALSLHWIVLFKNGFVLFVIPLALSLLATSTGSGGAFRALSGKSCSGKVGLAGATMGILALMYSISWLIIAQSYFWGWPQ